MASDGQASLGILSQHCICAVFLCVVGVVLLDSQRLSNKRENFHDFSLYFELSIRDVMYAANVPRLDTKFSANQKT